jgi:cell division septation protein DedD
VSKTPNPPSKPSTTPTSGSHLAAIIAGFILILGSLAFVAIVGMRVSWVPLRDTADTIGLHEVRQQYPLVIDGLDGLAVIASLALAGSPGYRWAIGTVIGLTGISLVLNVAHGSAAQHVTAAADWTTWGHAILASAAPTVCIGLGTHLAALTFQRLTDSLSSRRPAAETGELAEQGSEQGTLAPVAHPATEPTPALLPTPAPAISLSKPMPAITARIPAEPAQPSNAPAHLLTTRDVAMLKGVALSTVGTWVTRGKLTPVVRDERLGNLFDPASLN